MARTLGQSEQDYSTKPLLLTAAPWRLRVKSAVNVWEGQEKPHTDLQFQVMGPVNEEDDVNWDYSRTTIYHNFYLNVDELEDWENEKVEEITHFGNKLFAQLIQVLGISASVAEVADELPNQEVVAFIKGATHRRIDGREEKLDFPRHSIVVGGLENNMTFAEVE